MTAVHVPSGAPGLDARAHQSRRCVDRAAKLVVRELAEANPRRERHLPKRFCLPHVPDPRDQPLVEECFTELARLVGRAQVANDRLELRGLVEHVGPEPSHLAGAELEHRAVPEHALVFRAAQDEPRSPDTLCPARLESPPARHAQVTSQHDASLEAQQEILPDCLDRLQPPTVEPLRDPLHGRARVRRLDLDALADQRLQSRRCPPQRISLGHVLEGSDRFCPSSDVPSNLNIAVLSRRTGVPADTLRKWEQRYGVLQPDRTAGGQRRYSELDVARIEWLRERLAEGFRIGEAASLLGGAQLEAARTPADLRRTLYEAASRANLDGLRALLDQTFTLLPLEQALSRIVEPVLQRVGEGWASGELSVAQEHLVSAAIRARLERLLADARGGVRGVAVLACVPGELHELGLLMLGTLLRADGWQVAYLGADAPLDDAFDLAARLDAPLVCLSVTMREHVAALAKAPVPPGVTLVLGGDAASERVARRLGGRVVNGSLRNSVRELRKLTR